MSVIGLVMDREECCVCVRVIGGGKSVRVIRVAMYGCSGYSDAV